MGYASLRACVLDLESAQQLRRIDVPLDPKLEIAEVQRRVYAAQGPALLFTRVQGSNFPMLGNLFGTLPRARFVFRDALRSVERLLELKVDPSRAWKNPLRYAGVPWTALTMLPKRARALPVLRHETSVSSLPQLVSWPDDGGAFITLPQVYSEDPEAPGPMRANLGMYRIQLSGGKYQPDRQIGLHYQIHRGIGVHHQAALSRGERLRVNIFVGGPPAMTLAAVMPLPEGLPELVFAGALNRRGVRLHVPGEGEPAIHAEADFCITGYIEPDLVLPEGPFGDHLGYYSLQHDFPVLRVEHVYHRSDAIWPFTVVGRPPQEDTSFGALIGELTGPVIPTVIAGVHAVHAVDASGVHPLLLAQGSERYRPYATDTRDARPEELLTQANAILGQGQMSLAKYLLIIDKRDDPGLDIHDVGAFLTHVLARFDPRRDLHFQTETTIDTLDYSGSGLHRGSKLIIAARGSARRALPSELPRDFTLPAGLDEPRICMPGVLAVRGPAYEAQISARDADIPAPGWLERLCASIPLDHPINRFPWVVVCDDAEFCARSLGNFLWTTFTRSNPAADIQGVGAGTRDKHWGARGALFIDARRKPGHAPPLIEDPKVSAKIDALAAKGGPLHGLF
ncbi:MAG: UbiD family decarboxylase [Polyangiales bacterium]